MTIETLSLLVDGQRYGGWKGVKVTRGIERAVSDFQISVSERWPDLQERWRIPEGATCEVLIGDDKVITGYVDAVEASYDKGWHSVNWWLATTCLTPRSCRPRAKRCRSSVISVSVRWRGKRLPRLATVLDAKRRRVRARRA